VKCFAISFGMAFLAFGLLGVSWAANLPLAGDLDPSFGSGGLVTHTLGSGESPSISGIAVQPDGKIVVAGASSPGDHGFLLTRYLPDGSLDPSFGDAGYIETKFTYWALAGAVALQPDGKIVVAGKSFQGDDNYDSEFTLARYEQDGSVDTSFGTGGITNTPIPEVIGQPGSAAGADALAVLPGGKILAGGWSRWGGITAPAGSFDLIEYSSIGRPDPAFGEGGIVQTQFKGDDYLSGIAVLPDGEIVATGTGGAGGVHGVPEVDTMALARYEPDGSLDAGFGKSGKVTTAPKLHYRGGPATLQGAKIVVAGYADSGSDFFPVVGRFMEGGRLDSSFGAQGFVEIRRVTGQPTAVLTQADGKILVAVDNRGSDQQGDGAVVRLRRNGRLDTSFGRGGIVRISDEVSALALQMDQKILLGGGSGNAWTLERVLGGNNCVVPGLRGKTISKASSQLKTSHCSTGHVSKRFSSKVARGRVISTAPLRGDRLPGGTQVDLFVSKGKRP
jgi:uncharacterized delta-60 repeat protein